MPHRFDEKAQGASWKQARSWMWSCEVIEVVKCCATSQQRTQQSSAIERPLYARQGKVMPRLLGKSE
jgi:hypothetical protein